jgi:hypothetical protein
LDAANQTSILKEIVHFGLKLVRYIDYSGWTRLE